MDGPALKPPRQRGLSDRPHEPRGRQEPAGRTTRPGRGRAPPSRPAAPTDAEAAATRGMAPPTTGPGHGTRRRDQARQQTPNGALRAALSCGVGVPDGTANPASRDHRRLHLERSRTVFTATRLPGHEPSRGVSIPHRTLGTGSAGPEAAVLEQGAPRHRQDPQPALGDGQPNPPSPRPGSAAHHRSWARRSCCCLA